MIVNMGLLYKQYVVKKMHKPYTNDALWKHDVGIYQGVKLPMERSSDYFVWSQSSVVDFGVVTKTCQLLKVLRGCLTAIPWLYKLLTEP